MGTRLLKTDTRIYNTQAIQTALYNARRDLGPRQSRNTRFVVEMSSSDFPSQISFYCIAFINNVT